MKLQTCPHEGSFACDINRDSNYIAGHTMCKMCGLCVSETLTSLILETQKKHNFTHILASATAFGKVSEKKHLCGCLCLCHCQSTQRQGLRFTESVVVESSVLVIV